VSCSGPPRGNRCPVASSCSRHKASKHPIQNSPAVRGRVGEEELGNRGEIIRTVVGVAVIRMVTWVIIDSINAAPKIAAFELGEAGRVVVKWPTDYPRWPQMPRRARVAKASWSANPKPFAEAFMAKAPETIRASSLKVLRRFIITDSWVPTNRMNTVDTHGCRARASKSRSPDKTWHLHWSRGGRQGVRHHVRTPRNILSRLEPLDRSSRRESALKLLKKMERTHVPLLRGVMVGRA